MDKIQATVFLGSADDAFLVALKDNSAHGLRLSSGDKKYTIMKALRRFPDKSLRMIAKDLGCAVSYTSEVAKELYESGQLTRKAKRTGRDGKKYTAKQPSTERASPV